MGINEETNIIIKTQLGKYTGDIIYQTADGRYWKKWRGETLHTGEEIKKIRYGH